MKFLTFLSARSIDQEEALLYFLPARIIYLSKYIQNIVIDIDCQLILNWTQSF